MTFSDPSKNDFSAPLGRFWAPKNRRIEFFGSFLAPPWILRGPQNRLKSIFNIKNLDFWLSRAQPFSKIASGPFLGTTLVDLGSIFNENC